LRFRGVVYRAHNPRWAFSPLSGEGAARTGGRFNRPGTPALYTSLTLETAVREAAQGFPHKFDPLTLCSYDVDCEDIADLTAARERSRLDIAAADLACAWKLLAHEGKPSSHGSQSINSCRQGTPAFLSAASHPAQPKPT